MPASQAMRDAVRPLGPADRLHDLYGSLLKDLWYYAGLTSRRNQSGEMDYSGRIAKNGDSLLRSLLYETANVLLTVVRKAHPLKDWARRIGKRSSHKKTCVALARKLAVIMPGHSRRGAHAGALMPGR